MSKSKRLSLALCIAMSALMMTGCANLSGLFNWGRKDSPVPPLDASLKQKCASLAVPRKGDGETILKWQVNTISAYYECADRHQRAVQAYEDVRKELGK